MSKRKLGEETPPPVVSEEASVTPLFSPGLTERQQIALAMKLSGESSQGDSTSRPSKINKTNKHGESPLQIAAIKGDLKQVKLLIKQGAEVNTKDHAGWSPLHEAACKGYLEVCKALLKKGAQVNVHGYCDETPLHDATFNNHPKIVEVLLEHGASPLLKNKSGKVPYEIADNPHIKTMLLNAVMSVNAERLMPYSSEKSSGVVSNDGGTTEATEVIKQSLGDEVEAPSAEGLIKECTIIPNIEELCTKTYERVEAVEVSRDSVEEVSGELLLAPKQLFKSPVKEEPLEIAALPIEETTLVGDPITSMGPAIPQIKEELLEEREDCKEDLVKTEDEVDKNREMMRSRYFKYSHLLPGGACNTSITQNGPFTLYIGRNKRPVKRAPMMECRSPPTTRSRAGAKPVDTTEAEELKTLNEGRYLLKSAVVTPRKKWLHQHVTKKRHMGDIYELQRRGTPAEPTMPAWMLHSMLHTKKYLLQASVCGKLNEESEEHQYIEHIPPVMKEELGKFKQENVLLSCKHTADKERLLQQHEQSMLRVRRQAIMKHPTPSACSIMLQQQSCEYAKKLQTVSYDVNNEQLLLVMGEKVMNKFSELSEVMHKRHQQEADSQYAAQRFTWVNNIHQNGLYDMPILGNVDLWVERVEISRLKPHVEYYDEHDPSDSDDSNR